MSSAGWNLTVNSFFSDLSFKRLYIPSKFAKLSLKRWYLNVESILVQIYTLQTPTYTSFFFFCALSISSSFTYMLGHEVGVFASADDITSS